MEHKVLDHDVKVCSKCRENTRDTAHSWCRRCLRDDQQARRNKNRTKAREIARKHRLKSYTERRVKLLAFKDRPCMDCGNEFPHYVMQFDHRDQTTKIKAVATLMRNTVSWERVKREMDKCDLVCANCHAIRTWNRAH